MTVKEFEITITPDASSSVAGRLWESKNLLYWLAWKEIKARYRQTWMGAFWALLQPTSMMLVVSLAFGVLAKIPSEGVHYSVFALTGLVPWLLFAAVLNQVAFSLLNNGALISKVYFPRMIIPLSSSIVPLLDSFVTLLFLLMVSVFFGEFPKITILYALFFLGLSYLFALSLGLWGAALSVQYRDVQLLIPLLLQVGVYLSPVMYSFRLVPEKWRSLYAINPMVSIIEGFRWSLFDIGLINDSRLLFSVAFIGFLFVTGLYIFQKMERNSVDTL